MSVRDILIKDIGLTDMQTDLYMLVTTQGKMDCPTMARHLDVSESQAKSAAESLVLLGAFIEYSATEYEAMHPRFTAVNMYRRMCESKDIPFGRNKNVDSIGVALEQPYDDARTK